MLLTDASKELKIPLSTLRGWIKNNYFAAKKINNRWYIDVSSLYDFLSYCKHNMRLDKEVVKEVERIRTEITKIYKKIEEIRDIEPEKKKKKKVAPVKPPEKFDYDKVKLFTGAVITGKSIDDYDNFVKDRENLYYDINDYKTMYPMTKRDISHLTDKLIEKYKSGYLANDIAAKIYAKMEWTAYEKNMAREYPDDWKYGLAQATNEVKFLGNVNHALWVADLVFQPGQIKAIKGVKDLRDIKGIMITAIEKFVDDRKYPRSIIPKKKEPKEKKKPAKKTKEKKKPITVIKSPEEVQFKFGDYMRFDFLFEKYKIKAPTFKPDYKPEQERERIWRFIVNLDESRFNLLVANLNPSFYKKITEAGLFGPIRRAKANTFYYVSKFGEIAKKPLYFMATQNEIIEAMKRINKKQKKQVFRERLGTLLFSPRYRMTGIFPSVPVQSDILTKVWEQYREPKNNIEWSDSFISTAKPKKITIPPDPDYINFGEAIFCASRAATTDKTRYDLDLVNVKKHEKSDKLVLVEATDGKRAYRAVAKLPNNYTWSKLTKDFLPKGINNFGLKVQEKKDFPITGYGRRPITAKILGHSVKTGDVIWSMLERPNYVNIDRILPKPEELTLGKVNPNVWAKVQSDFSSLRGIPISKTNPGYIVIEDDYKKPGEFILYSTADYNYRVYDNIATGSMTKPINYNVSAIFNMSFVNELMTRIRFIPTHIDLTHFYAGQQWKTATPRLYVINKAQLYILLGMKVE